MTLATASETNQPRRLSMHRSGQLALSFDAFLMAACLAVCALLFAEGGPEAALFAFAGSVIGARNAPRGGRWAGAYSGGFAGLFVGALFAAFFHGALAALVQSL